MSNGSAVLGLAIEGALVGKRRGSFATVVNEGDAGSDLEEQRG